ncbi:hypothetical protein B0H10DRAFT_2057735 [Mycena sp. CBHHK59/15]|nr:hypothetical protein B0H10DRAFT_2057735 [Mycena sp. CBHHK59/15]
MLPASSSESSGPHPKRKLEEADVEELFSHFMTILSSESIVKEHFPGGPGSKAWTTLQKKVLADNKKTPKLSRPFTDGKSFYADLFEGPPAPISLREDKNPVSPAQPHPYQEAAGALQGNPLWKGVKDHIIMANETGCRTAIDMVVLTAINLAQQDIVLDDSVDTTLSQRHSLPDTKCLLDGFSNEIRSWVVLQQEVEIPDQDLKVGLTFHGVLDYILGVVSTTQVDIKPHRFLGAQLYDSAFAEQTIRKSLSSIVEAKSMYTMNQNAHGQVLVQGAALCILSKRPAVVNILTNGLDWVFYKISKVPDAGAAGKPFKASRTRMLSVLEPEELPVILRLLKTSILSSPDEFEILAAVAKA